MHSHLKERNSVINSLKRFYLFHYFFKNLPRSLMKRETRDSYIFVKDKKVSEDVTVSNFEI